jgi:hypothetical protein
MERLLAAPIPLWHRIIDRAWFNNSTDSFVYTFLLMFQVRLRAA